MTEAQKLQVRGSEIRQRLNEIAGLEGDALTTEIRSESDTLTVEYRDTETKLRAAIVADDGAVDVPGAGEDAEARELRSLRSRASIGSIFAAAVEHRSADGAEAELQKHLHLSANQIPIDMLRGERETRAVTTAPTSVGTMESEVVMPVFADGIGAFLGVDRPVVDAGDSVYPVLATRPAVRGPHTDSSAAAETDGTINATLLAPERIQASWLIRRTDSARFRGMDEALRMALNSGLQEKLDDEAIAGAAGLLTGANLANHAAAAVTTFAQYVSRFCFARVDGRYAMQGADLRVVMGAGTYGHAGSVYRAAEADDNALDRLMEKTGGVRVSAHVPAVSGNKQNSIVRLGLRRDMVQPMWNGVSIVVDEYSTADKGEIEIYAILLMNTKILRADGFYKQETQHA